MAATAAVAASTIREAAGTGSTEGDRTDGG